MKGVDGLRWTLGIVILIEAILFVRPGGGHAVAAAHLPDALRYVLGGGEIVGCVLLLVRRWAVWGGWILIAVFMLAMVIHLVHGMYDVGDLAIYTAAAWSIVTAGRARHG
jgi:hypothetical protein